MYVLFLVTVDMICKLVCQVIRVYSLRIIQANVGSNWPSYFRGEEIVIKVNDFHVTIFGQIFFF